MSIDFMLVYFLKALSNEFTHYNTALATDKRAWTLKTLFFVALVASGFTYYFTYCMSHSRCLLIQNILFNKVYR